MSTRKPVTSMAVNSVDELVYGSCKHPITTKMGIEIGGGTMYPELNHTLPPMIVNDSTIQEAYDIYREMIEGILKRAVELHQDAVTIEYETVPDFTEHPKYGIESTKIILDVMKEYNAKYGIKSALRATPNDMREMTRPPVMRSGSFWDGMLEFFNGCGEVGADYISIESTGGKEIHDEALQMCRLDQSIFAMGVMAATDMEFLWGHMVDICNKHGMIAAGDSSCGFANTAMVLAENGYIPRTFAAVVRVASVPRALMAYEMGATGPSKDCEYIGGYLKAITGAPIAMEGRMACGAHLSPVGNAALVLPDLWSNESIQQVQLLSGSAVTAGIEQLIYDCRMMNTAKKLGYQKQMMEILQESDCHLDPHAYILRPDVIMQIAPEIIKSDNPLVRTKTAAACAVKVLKEAVKTGQVAVDERDAAYLDIMEEQIADIPDDANKFWEEIKEDLDLSKFTAKDYDLA